MGRPFTTTLVLSGMALHVTPVCSAQDSLPTSLDAYVAGAIRSMDLPGAAIALVKDGRVIVAKGYGVRELGKPDPIDAQTIFDIASLTKGFTAAVIASMPKMFGEEDLATMARVRTAFDPQGLCNPGKVLPTPRLCGERPGKYRPHPLEEAGVIERL